MATSRLQSLDVFRGITIAGMILVNNPGSWSTVYEPLLHAEWHGATPTDWIFPFFLFIMGVAIPFALGKRIEAGAHPRALWKKIGVRALIIFGLGLFLAGFPNFGFSVEGIPLARRQVWYFFLGLLMLAVFGRGLLQQKTFAGVVWARRRSQLGWFALGMTIMMVAVGYGYYDLSHLRIPGVLQRIALVYFACANLFLFAPIKGQYWATVSVLLLYWGLMTLVPVPGYGEASLLPERNLGAWLDRLVLGTAHLWRQSKTWDPEGLLSTLPAVGTGMLGVFSGVWLRSDRDAHQKIRILIGWGVLLLVLGQAWGWLFPINKKIWTSSYVLYTGGLAMLFLAICYYLIDIKGWKNWAWPFRVFGMNALFVFILSGIIAKLLYRIPVGNISLQQWLYETFFLTWITGKTASLAWAVSFLILLFVPCYGLYRHRFFIKV